MFLVFCSLLFSYLILYLLTFLFPPLLSSFVLLSHLSFSHSHLISHHLYFILSDTFCHQINICLWNQQVFLKRDRKVKKLMLYILQNTQKQPTWFFSSVFFSLYACGHVFLLYDMMFSIKGIVKNLETQTKSI